MFTTNKYHAKKTEYNGRTYDSAKEAHRAYELDMLGRAGHLKGVEYQPVYLCVVNGKKICKYVADFKVYYTDGRVEVEDVKGMVLPIFKLKKKLVEALFDIEIKII
jgi:hypothetical protein